MRTNASRVRAQCPDCQKCPSGSFNARTLRIPIVCVGYGKATIVGISNVNARYMKGKITQGGGPPPKNTLQVYVRIDCTSTAARASSITCVNSLIAGPRNESIGLDGIEDAIVVTVSEVDWIS